MKLRLLLLLASVLGVAATAVAIATTHWQFGLLLYASTVVVLGGVLWRAAAQREANNRQRSRSGQKSRTAKVP